MKVIAYFSAGVLLFSINSAFAVVHKVNPSSMQTVEFESNPRVRSLNDFDNELADVNYATLTLPKDVALNDQSIKVDLNIDELLKETLSGLEYDLILTRSHISQSCAWLAPKAYRQCSFWRELRRNLAKEIEAVKKDLNSPTLGKCALTIDGGGEIASLNKGSYTGRRIDTSNGRKIQLDLGDGRTAFITCDKGRHVTRSAISQAFLTRGLNLNLYSQPVASDGEAGGQR